MKRSEMLSLITRYLESHIPFLMLNVRIIIANGLLDLIEKAGMFPACDNKEAHFKKFVKCHCGGVMEWEPEEGEA